MFVPNCHLAILKRLPLECHANTLYGVCMMVGCSWIKALVSASSAASIASIYEDKRSRPMPTVKGTEPEGAGRITQKPARSAASRSAAAAAEARAAAAGVHAARQQLE